MQDIIRIIKQILLFPENLVMSVGFYLESVDQGLVIGFQRSS